MVDTSDRKAATGSVKIGMAEMKRGPLAVLFFIGVQFGYAAFASSRSIFALSCACWTLVACRRTISVRDGGSVPVIALL
jgi:hypothetical protein